MVEPTKIFDILKRPASQESYFGYLVNFADIDLRIIFFERRLIKRPLESAAQVDDATYFFFDKPAMASVTALSTRADSGNDKSRYFSKVTSPCGHASITR